MGCLGMACPPSNFQLDPIWCRISLAPEYPAWVNIQKATWKMAIEIVDFPMKNGWIFPVRYGNSGFSHEKWVDLSSSLWK